MLKALEVKNVGEGSDQNCLQTSGTVIESLGREQQEKHFSPSSELAHRLHTNAFGLFFPTCRKSTWITPPP